MALVKPYRSIFVPFLGGCLSVLIGLAALSYSQVPDQVNPAQLINQIQRDRWFQTKLNYYGPITGNDYLPKNDAVIEFHNMDVDGQIVKPAPTEQPPDRVNSAF